MNGQIVRDHLLRRPFAPFSIGLSDGSTYFVRHPEPCILGRTEIHLEGSPDQEIVTIGLLHITKLVVSLRPHRSSGPES